MLNWSRSVKYSCIQDVFEKECSRKVGYLRNFTMKRIIRLNFGCVYQGSTSIEGLGELLPDKILFELIDI